MLYFPTCSSFPARLRAAMRHRLPSSLLRRSSVQAAPRPFGSRGPRPAISRRWCLRVLVIAGVALGALFTVGAPAFASTSSTSSHASVTVAAAAVSPVTRGTLDDQITLDDRVAPDLPSGVCQVPGIGDIGGVLGFCNAGTSGIIGDLNNICEPGLPVPEQATGGIDSMISPPETAVGGKTLYDNYGVAGQFWAAHDLQCSDMTSLIGNNVAGMVFDASKAMDRVTITVYQAAAGDSILTWLRNAVDQLITSLGNAIYFPYLGPVVLLGAMWLAWQGLIRKRATRAIEGTLWMVIAATAATCLIARPAAFTGIGTSVSNGVTQVLNTAFAKLPSTGNGNCLPIAAGDPQSETSDYSFTSGNGMVDENANELWSVLVCKPWLYGELGSTAYATSAAGQQTVVNTYGRDLLWSQAVAANEKPTAALMSAKQSTYTGIATALQANDPAVYPLFQGIQWTTRLEIAFGALFAAMVAGLLILLVALTLIVLKLGFLLLLVAGPFFLIIGTHPGFGRIIAIRWFEMLVGVLMKQVAIAITLSVLLYCYSLIMGTTDQVLPWALKILMIALVTVTVFIYRRPFQHLFSAVGYGTIGSQERAEYSLREAGTTFRDAIPGTRVARWARRNPGQVTALAAGAAAGGLAGVAAGAGSAGAAAAAAGTGADAAGAGVAAATSDAYTSRLRTDVSTTADGDGASGGAGNGTGSNGRRLAAPLNGAGARAKAMAEADGGAARPAPPLDLPSRNGGNGSGGSGSGGSGSGGSGAGSSGVNSSGWLDASRGAGGAAGRAASGWSRGSGRSAGSRSRPSSDGRSAPPLSGTGSSGSGSGGSGSGGRASGPAWPGSGWSGVRRPRPAPRHDADAKPETGNADAGEAPRPFWIRPPKRDK
jgi:TrbL/VirB6 plasmid conjugal transfer protein